MKKLLFLFFLIPAFSQAQEWFAPDHRWVFHMTGGLIGMDAKLEMYADGDTVIHGKPCRKWSFHSTGIFTMLPRFTRSEGPAAFYYEEPVDSFVKIYDFSLPVGSVVHIPKYHIDGFTYRIDAIDTVIAGDFQLKRQRVSYLSADGQPTGWKFDILDKIGMVGLMPLAMDEPECSFVFVPEYQCSSVIDGIDLRFLCFSSNAGGFHPFSNECLLTAATEPSAPAIALSPNPATDAIELQVEGQAALQTVVLRDLSGRVCRLQRGDTRLLNLRDTAPGVYLLEIQFENGARVLKKVIKH